MSQELALLSNIGVNNTTGQSQRLPAEKANRSLVASVYGTGALAATLIYEVSIDGITWATRMTITLSGSTLVTDTDVDENSPFPYVRGRVTGLSGTNAKVTLAVCAA